jgi:hypothetical protein
MTFDDFRVLIPEYLSNQLTPEDAELFEARLSSSPELRAEVEELRWLWNGMGLLPEPQPSAALRARFYQKLNSATAVRPRPAANFFQFWGRALFPQIAGGVALFVLGIYFGHINAAGKAQTEQLAEMRAQVQSLQQTVALSLLDRQSAASRMQGVEWSDRIVRPDDHMMGALVAALNHDPNVNVRLSSLNALERFSNEATVRKALIDSVAAQDSPLVQIALIDQLVEMRERNAARELRSLSANTGMNVAVRQRAQWGLTKLGFE